VPRVSELPVCTVEADRSLRSWSGIKVALKGRRRDAANPPIRPDETVVVKDWLPLLTSLPLAPAD
jgi:hypothetical protein